MTQSALPGSARFTVARNPEKLRENARYQRIRALINSRYSPLSGGTNWEQIYQEGHSLLLDEGVDLVLAGYLAVAATKTRGVEGLAFGLELMLVVVVHSPDEQSLGGERWIDMLSWTMAKLQPEIKAIGCTPSNLRDWYRSEYACQQLYEVLKIKGEPQLTLLDSVGYMLFEKLDGVAALAPETFHQPPAKPRVAKRLIQTLVLVGTAIVSIGIGYWFRPMGEAQLTQRLPEYFPPPPVVVATIEDRVEALFSAEASVKAAPLQTPAFQLELTELERYYKRFSSVRTQAANLERVMLSGEMPSEEEWGRAQELAQELKDYSSSLSPLLGRAYFIDELIQQQQFNRASEELDKSDRLLKALIIKRTIQRVALLENVGELDRESTN